MQPSDAGVFRGAALPTALVGAGAVVVSLLVAGAKGALGAALATVVVIAFFSISALAVSYAAKISPQTMMLAGLASYAVKILAMMILVAALDEVSIWNTTAFGWTVIALALAWIFAEFRITLQAKKPYIDEPAAPEEVSDEPSLPAERNP